MRKGYVPVHDKSTLNTARSFLRSLDATEKPNTQKNQAPKHISSVLVNIRAICGGAGRYFTGDIPLSVDLESVDDPACILPVRAQPSSTSKKE
jgi:hypothetical protein